MVKLRVWVECGGRQLSVFEHVDDSDWENMTTADRDAHMRVTAEEAVNSGCEVVDETEGGE